METFCDFDSVFTAVKLQLMSKSNQFFIARINESKCKMAQLSLTYKQMLCKMNLNNERDEEQMTLALDSLVEDQTSFFSILQKL